MLLFILRERSASYPLRLARTGTADRHLVSCLTILHMLLPEHRSALENIIARIYDGGSRPFDDVAGQLTLSSGMNGAAAAEQLTVEIISCVRIQCARQMRARNRAVLPPQCQLPVELWAAVFAHLAQRDRVTVSHVSHDWREASMVSGQLWTSPFFLSAEHAAECDCQRCKSPRPCYDCGRWRRGEHDPVAQVRAFLERSGSFPICLKMAVFSQAAPSALTNLDAVVQPHIRRIESLSFFTSDVDVTDDFLQSISAFSALKSLTLELETSNRLTWKCAQAVQLPELRSLNIVGPLYCAHDEPFELLCPAVTFLKAMFYSATHLLPLLKACPAVQHLELEIGPRTVDIALSETLIEVHTLLKEAHPTEVRLTKAYKGDLEALLRLFNATGIPTVKIACFSGEYIPGHELAQFLCGEVANPVLLECVLVDKDVTECTSFRLTTSNDTHERTCTVSISDRDDISTMIRDLWGKFPASSFQSIQQLHASSYLWPTLFYAGENADSAAITHARIDIDGRDSLVEWLQGRAVAIQEGTERILSRLEVLHFSLMTPNSSFRPNAGLIRAAFGIGPKLRLLKLEGFTVEGDLTVLDTISHEIRVV